MLVADQSNQSIRQLAWNPVSSQWEVTTIAGNGPGGGCGFADGVGTAARLCYPQGLAAAGAGTAYVADSNNNAIRKLTKSGGSWTVSTVARSLPSSQVSEATISYPTALALDVPKTHLAIAQPNLGNVVLLDLSTGAATAMVGKAGSTRGDVDAPSGPGLAARLSYPKGVAAADPSTVYVAEGYGLRQFRYAGGIWSSSTIYSASWPVQRNEYVPSA